MSNEIVNLIKAGELEKALWKTVNIIEHDIACWKEVRDKAQGFDAVIYTIAKLRVESLKLEADKIYEAILDKQKEQQREQMKQPLAGDHEPNNWDYTKRIHRKGHGWKANHDGNI